MNVVRWALGLLAPAPAPPRQPSRQVARCTSCGAPIGEERRARAVSRGHVRFYCSKRCGDRDRKRRQRARLSGPRARA